MSGFARLRKYFNPPTPNSGIEMNLTLYPIVFLLLLTSGCSTFIGSATQKMADNLSLAMLNQDDPQTVKAAAPAYLIMLDSLIREDPDNVRLRQSGAKLYASYSSAFVSDEKRAKRLASKSLNHARIALCLELETVCKLIDQKLDELLPAIKQLQPDQQPALYAFSSAWASWIQAHTGDWNALAQIPKLTAMLEQSILLDDTYDQGGAYLYLGVLSSQIPPALGGKPELGREYFEKALILSNGKNLMVKVLMAEHYARLIFNQELHDQLLNDVLKSDPHEPELTLINSLAQIRASELLAESPEFF